MQELESRKVEGESSKTEGESSKTERQSRKTILAPGESPDPDRYAKREGLHAQDPLNFTLFRQVERKYKHRNEPLDLSEAIDLKAISQFPGMKPFEISSAFFSKYSPKSLLFPASNEDLLLQLKGYTFDAIPGFLIFPGLLSHQLQVSIVNHVFEECMKHPNLSNLDALYHLPREHSLLDCKDLGLTACRIKDNESVPIDEDFLRRIRWYTLGYQYNWTTKEYDFESSPNSFPCLLDEVSREIACLAGFPTFIPQAGVVNLYQPKDTLMGHVDRSEKNMQMPLISLSIGHSCVFLMGGASRDSPVYPFILSSGDVVLFTESCRLNFHGVPRILEGTFPEWMLKDPQIPSIMHTSRLNINVRQVI